MFGRQELHIVSFDIPYPANYGGIIDVFYKIKELKKLGIKIHLHCFYKERKQTKELNKYCSSVNYYKRKTNFKNLLSWTPFIVKSRKDKELIKNILKIKCPILFEGLHSTSLINNKRLSNYKKFTRIYNIETNYYKLLAKSEKNFLKKIYFLSECFKISFYQKKLQKSQMNFTITKKDQNYFQRFSKCTHIKAFHSNSKITSKEGKGNYSLYHGNLSIAENENAAFFIINKIFKKTKHKLIIAGKNPSPGLKKLISKNKNVKLIKDPTEKEINNTIKNAHINILYTNQNTGIKLKLVESLYRGRFCIVNKKMTEGSELENYCHLVSSKESWISKIKKLENKFFDEKEISKRKNIEKLINNKKEAKRIQKIIFN